MNSQLNKKIRINQHQYNVSISHHLTKLIIAPGMATICRKSWRFYKKTYSQVEYRISRSNIADTATQCDADCLAGAAEHLITSTKSKPN